VAERVGAKIFEVDFIKNQSRIS